jgi:hypothetical protein
MPFLALISANFPLMTHPFQSDRPMSFVASSLGTVADRGDTSTNYTDVGVATNQPSRYYRIRLGP